VRVLRGDQAALHAGLAILFTRGEAPCPTTYDVYFGTEYPLELICDDVTSPSSCDPGPLEPCTTYYWQVCAENQAGETCGPVWSFTTTCPCDVPPAPINPDPPDGAVNVPVDTDLAWSGGAERGGAIGLRPRST
jgi:hypothetical protein